MQNLLKFKLNYEGKLRMIPGTEFKIEQGRLRIFDNDKLVAEFPQDRVECYFGWVIPPMREAIPVPAGPKK